MDSSLSESTKAIERAGEVMAAFENIEGAVQMIRDMTAQIATAIEEHLVTEEINRHVVVINDAVRHVSGNGSREQRELSSAPKQLVGRLRTE